MGSTKYDVFKTTKVGVANPSAKTETFCLSAAEMELAGVPVVSRGKWGMFDTVVNGRTGLLCKSKIGLKRDIIKLLKNNSLNKEYGNNARSYVKEKFEVTSIIEKWENVITETYNGKKPEYHKVTGNITNDFKWIKMIVRFFRYNLGIKALPAFNDIKQNVKRLVRK